MQELIARRKSRKTKAPRSLAGWRRSESRSAAPRASRCAVIACTFPAPQSPWWLSRSLSLCHPRHATSKTHRARLRGGCCRFSCLAATGWANAAFPHKIEICLGLGRRVAWFAPHSCMPLSPSAASPSSSVTDALAVARHGDTSPVTQFRPSVSATSSSRLSGDWSPAPSSWLSSSSNSMASSSSPTRLPSVCSSGSSCWAVCHLPPCQRRVPLRPQ